MLSSLSQREGEFTFSVFEELHVEIAVLFDPALIDRSPHGSEFATQHFAWTCKLESESHKRAAAKMAVLPDG